jgi:hypothetical protein
MPEVDSSAVDRVDYTATSGTLDIWYKGGGHYCYFDVPPELYHALLAAPSIGIFVNEVIKPHFRYEERTRRRRFRPHED